MLDDLTLLHQIAKDGGSPATKTRLFEPRTTHRYSRQRGFGSLPVAGKNFHFAAAMIPAYMYEKTHEGEVKVFFLDAGENPPDGVLVHYSAHGESQLNQSRWPSSTIKRNEILDLQEQGS